MVENRWLDHLKIFCWHPWLAEQPEIRSVCGDQHLRILLQHWPNQANLNLHYTERANKPALCEPREPDDSRALAAGKLLGEMTVHRHLRSRVWTGTPQVFECILSAITGRESQPRAADYALAPFHGRHREGLSRAHIAGWA